LYPRYVYFIVVRGKEDEGVNLLYVSRALHEIIVENEEKVPIPLSWSKKLLQWMLNKLGIGWKLNKYTDVLDLQHGYDFKVCCKFRNAAGHDFPDYRDSYFIKKSCPVGTESQIAKWLKQIESMTADEQCAVTMMRA
jgi:hypothetical protein